MSPTAPIELEQTPGTDAAFELEIGGVFEELRRAIAEVISALRPPVRRPAELRRLLDLGQKVSWSLFTAATAPDARSLASLLPGRRGMERFFDACAAHGVAGGVLDRARAAFERFEETVARHAGSRDAFETMVAELRGSAELGAGTSADLKHKRSAFRALSLLWGRQARVVCGARIVFPSQTPGRLDTVFITGMVGLHRTRRAGPLHTTAYRGRRITLGDGADLPPPEPLDPRERGPDAIGLLRDFCSQPVPEFVLRGNRQGYRSHELVSMDLGPSGEVTYFTGEIGRGDTLAPGPSGDTDIFVAKAVDFPIETFLGDILMHRSIRETAVPEVRVYALPQDGAMELRERDLLPLAEHADDLGMGLYATQTPLVPRYPELIKYALERAGLCADDFRLFRCRIDYPVLSSRIVMQLR